MTAKFNTPQAIDFTQPAGWTTWIQRFSHFRLATRLHKEDGEIQVSLLVYAMEKDAEAIYATFKLDDSNDHCFIVGAFNDALPESRRDSRESSAEPV